MALAGRVLYGALFVVVLPALLAAWARSSAHNITLTPPLTPAAGVAAALGGFALMVAGWAALWFYGGGLPMNAYPPPRYVERGVYRFLAHPIYCGFTAIVAGISAAARSGSGFWLVTPAVAFASMALVLGYEKPQLDARFGREAVSRPLPGWPLLRRAAEEIANSWREWRIGRVRMLSHGLYGGCATFAGAAIAGAAGLPAAAIATVVLCAVVGAALWAQLVEGSPQLLRPFGFYGGILAGIGGTLLAPLFGASIWLALSAFALGGPWVQAAGRLRCLVQGCCHGRPAPKEIGIRYRHSMSRVCRLTPWRGVPLHATPVYSILWNAATGALLSVLWAERAALGLVAGTYLLMNGLGRFAEEAYRGEPQTHIYAGLRMYQWLALASVIAGAILTTAHTPATPVLMWNWRVLPLAGAAGIVTGAALGVDFPDSTRRFSRLA